MSQGPKRLMRPSQQPASPALRPKLHPARRVLSAVLAACILGLMGPASSLVAKTASPAQPDVLLKSAVESSLGGDPNQAVDAAREASEREPRSRLAHWLKAQSVLALAGSAPRISKKDQDLLEEARARLFTPPPGWLPSNLVRLHQGPELGAYTLLVDLSVARIYVFRSEAGRPALVDEFYTTMGLYGGEKLREGDKRTPIGAYRLVKEIKNPRSDGFLGHLAITLDYPNAEDRKSHRTGGGIWIHGVPDDVHVRPPKASDGCLAIANPDMERIKRYVEFGRTQIVVTPRVDWLSPADWSRRAGEVVARLQRQDADFRRGAVFVVSDDRPLVAVQPQADRLVRTFWSRQTKGLTAVAREEL